MGLASRFWGFTFLLGMSILWIELDGGYWSLDEYRIVYTDHASDMMRERRISEEEIFHVITYGIVIKEYLDDIPYPSVLLLC